MFYAGVGFKGFRVVLLDVAHKFDVVVQLGVQMLGLFLAQIVCVEGVEQ